MSFVLSASALGVLVRAHDISSAPLDSLSETFVSRSEDSLLCLAIISATHVHRTIPNQRLRKPVRLAYRVCVSIVIITLPLAHLDSLQLIATTTGLVVSVLVLELVCVSCWGENFLWEKECKRDQATYSAKCAIKREELERSAREGTVVDVEDIARREVGEKGVVGVV